MVLSFFFSTRFGKRGPPGGQGSFFFFSFFFRVLQHLELSPRGGVEGIRHSSNSSRVGLLVTALI